MAIRSIQRNNIVRYNENEGKLPKGRKRQRKRGRRRIKNVVNAQA